VIPRPVGIPADAWWLVGSWFPDGTQLLANAYEPGGNESIWTVSLLRESPRKLREGASGLDISPDGTHLAFCRFGASGEIREIRVMGSQGDKPQRVLALGEKEWCNSVHWSPDSQRLAYISTFVVGFCRFLAEYFRPPL
jgi:WD40 repeat protein